MIEVRVPGSSSDNPLHQLILQELERMFQRAVEAEAEKFVSAHRDLRDARGRRRVVRNGYLRPRTLKTQFGQIKIRQPRVRDLGGALRFRSQVLPGYLRKIPPLKGSVLCLVVRNLLQGRSIATKGSGYSYLWGEAIPCNGGDRDTAAYVLVLVGVARDGKVDLLAVMEACCTGEHCWKALVEQAGRRGLARLPRLVFAGDADGLKAALQKVGTKFDRGG